MTSAPQARSQPPTPPGQKAAQGPAAGAIDAPRGGSPGHPEPQGQSSYPAATTTWPLLHTPSCRLVSPHPWASAHSTPDGLSTPISHTPARPLCPTVHTSIHQRDAPLASPSPPRPVAEAREPCRCRARPALPTWSLPLHFTTGSGVTARPKPILGGPLPLQPTQAHPQGTAGGQPPKGQPGDRLGTEPPPPGASALIPSVLPTWTWDTPNLHPWSHRLMSDPHHPQHGINEGACRGGVVPTGPRSLCDHGKSKPGQWEMDP